MSSRNNKNSSFFKILKVSTLIILIGSFYFGYRSFDIWLNDPIEEGTTTESGEVKGVVYDNSLGKRTIVQEPVKDSATPSQGEVKAVEDEITDNSLVFRLPVFFLDLVHGISAKFDTTVEVGIDLLVGNDATIGNDLTVNGQLITANLNIGNDALIGNDLEVDNDLNVDGTITSVGDIIAPNVIYSVTAGTGIEVSGDQEVTITANDLGSSQEIFKNFKFGSDTISAGDNDDTLTFESGTGITFSTSGKIVTVGADPDILNNSGWDDGGTTVALSTSTDNVGIGTTTAGYKLEVDGTSNISGATTLGSTLGVSGNTTVGGTFGVTGLTTLSNGLTVSSGITTLTGGASISSGIDNNSGGITNAGSITGATGLTSSGTITFSNLSTGVLHSNVNGVISSSAVNLAGGSNEITGTLPVINGGTGFATVLQGDIIYGSATNVFSKLSAGGDGDILQLSSGVPVWSTVAGVGSLCPNCVIDDPGGHQTITPTSTTATGLIVKQAASGSVDVFRIESNDGSTEYFKVDSSGNVVLGNQTSSGVFTVSPSSTDPISISPVAQGANQYTGTITSEDLTTNRTWTFPDVSGIVCMASGNCTGTSASVGGSGTTNYIAKWSDTYAVGNSGIYDDGTNIGIGTTTMTALLDIDGTFSANGNVTLGGDLSLAGHATVSGSLRVDQYVDLNDTLGVSGATTLGSTLDVTGLATFGGNVGVGTSSPLEKLHISNDSDADIRLQEASDNSSFASVFGYKSRGTVASPTIVSNGDGALSFVGRGYDGSDFRNLAEFRIEVDGTPGANDTPGRLTFYTTPDGSSTSTERMRIDNQGNVGIGSITPGYKLDIVGDVGIDGDLSFIGAQSINTTAGDLSLSPTGGNVIFGTNIAKFNDGTNNWDILGSSNDRLQLTQSGSGYSEFFITATGFGSGTDSFIASSGNSFVSGNFGIGSTSPGQKLDVVASGINGIKSAVDNSTGGTVASLAGLTSAFTTLATNTTTRAYGLNSSVQETGGTITHAFGAYSQIGISSGSIGSGYGFYADSDQVIGGSMTNYAGVFIETTAVASNNTFLAITGSESIPTGNYGIYNSSTFDNYFAGNVGIGTTSPAQKLAVDSGSIAIYGDGGGNAFRRYTAAGVSLWYLDHDDTNAYISNEVAGAMLFRTDATERMRIDASGNVGIGTSTPGSYKLRVEGNQILNGNFYRSAHNNGFLVGSYNNIAANGAQTNPIYTIGSSYIPNATTLGNMYGIGYALNSQASYLTDSGPDSWGAYIAADGDARIFLGAGADADSYFNTTGNLGIGTTDPGTKLHLYDAGDNLLRLEHSSATGNPYLDFRQAGTRRAYIQLADSGNDLRLNSEYGDVSFYSGGVERMEIQSNGNIGIGSTAPVGLLDLQKSNFVNGKYLNIGVQAGGSGTAYGIYQTGGTLGGTVVGAYFSNSVGIGTTSPAEELDIVGRIRVSDGIEGTGHVLRPRDTGASNIIFNKYDATGNFYFRKTSTIGGNSPYTDLFYIRNDGRIYIPSLLGSSSTGSDVRYSTSSKELFYYTSSRRYKDNITPIEIDTSKIYDLEVVSYTANNPIEGREGVREFGMIAEDTYEVIPEIVTWKDGKINAINYSQLPVLLLSEVQKHEKKINLIQSGLSIDDAGLVTITQDKISSDEATLVKTVNNITENISFVDKVVTFLNEVVFTAKAKFMASVEFLEQVTFGGEVKFNEDTVGKFVVPSGVTKVKVSFDEKFTQVPTVYLSAQNQVNGGYSLSSVSIDGFVVTLSQEQSADIVFDWLAVLGSRTENATIEVLDEVAAEENKENSGEVAGVDTDDEVQSSPVIESNIDVVPSPEPIEDHEETPISTSSATVESSVETSSAEPTSEPTETIDPNSTPSSSESAQPN